MKNAVKEATIIYFKSIKNFVENKKVFCRIDIHSYHWNLCYLCDGEVIEKIRIVGNCEKLKSHTEQLYGSAHSIRFVYEAGFSGFYLYRHLEASGYKCTITPPNQVLRSGNKVKTDKRDATKLAQFLSIGLLKNVFSDRPGFPNPGCIKSGLQNPFNDAEEL
ncbi:MAG: transposase [bacterium]